MKGRKPKLVSIAGGKVGGRIPAPPGGLCQHGQAEWKRVAPILHRRALLGDDVLATLEAYCRAIGLGRTYTAMMDAEGHILQTDKGPQSHPAFKMLMGAMREARLLAAELHLTPQRRGRADEEPRADPWEGMLG